MPLGFVSIVSFQNATRFASFRPGPSNLPRKGLRRQNPVCVGKSLEEAVQKGYVEDFGRVVKLNSNGCFPPRNGLGITQKLRPSLDKIVREVQEVIRRKDVRAIFLRGSVATGNFSAERDSDLDLIVILQSHVSREEKSAVYAIISKTAKFSLGLSCVDIRYICLQSQRPGQKQRSLDTNTLILLKSYAVCLYCSDTALLAEDVETKPTGDDALNIREYERWFLRLFQKARGENQAMMQCNSIKWLCKRALRSIADLGSIRLREHSRDLVPCYRLASRAFPDHEGLLILGLQYACANAKNGYLGLSESTFLTKGYDVARDLVELTEELSLYQNFGSAVEKPFNLNALATPYVFRSSPWVDDVKEFMATSIAQVKSNLDTEKICVQEFNFLRSGLPNIALNPQPISEGGCQAATTRIDAESSLYLLLKKTDEPHASRRVIPSENGVCSNSKAIIEELSKTVDTIQCRVSAGAEVTFCRDSHPWIDTGRFSPPSVLESITLREAMIRMQEGNALPPLRYQHEERLYIQSPVMKKKRKFQGLEKLPLCVAQEERIWVSTHGTVSGLHYDASYSCLLQRSGMKRMLFFPPACLEHMGIYPLGHPLHRRARVNLARPNSSMFKDFWKSCAHRATEVVLEEGDLVVFPPFWSHYTESLTSNRCELSISHTLRFV
ncbi:unnamed protein product [Chondrus crispus]|uniref:JmjC domain-containing protein n=1 Tax=Chondrus crispus TaxID=2769 RepID=R7Q851_CHOCR|nr:unnamed protein product [Chondrus crispus]CDF33541.1 unnamed protein product [Chondrus crispus]|eukprot:XP_005713344.1 unnamed protein product [Chondrus crispus]